MSEYLLTRVNDLREKEVRSSLDRRSSIVRAAVGTLSRHGFRGATTRRIARDAGVSEALLYKHFSSKDDLLDAVLDHLLETFRSPCRPPEASQADSDREFLIRYTRQLLAQAQSNPEEVRILFYAGLQGHRLAGEYHERQVTSVLQALISRIEIGQAEGRYRQMPADVAANGFLSMIRFQVLKLVIFGKSVPAEEHPDWPELFVEIFLRGVS